MVLHTGLMGIFSHLHLASGSLGAPGSVSLAPGAALSQRGVPGSKGLLKESNRISEI